MARAMRVPVKAKAEAPAVRAPRPGGGPVLPDGPAAPVMQAVALPTPVAVLPNYLGVSPLMQSSLPPMASGADAYVRQFNGSHLAKRRFLPVGLVP